MNISPSVDIGLSGFSFSSHPERTVTTMVLGEVIEKVQVLARNEECRSSRTSNLILLLFRTNLCQRDLGGAKGCSSYLHKSLILTNANGRSLKASLYGTLFFMKLNSYYCYC